MRKYMNNHFGCSRIFKLARFAVEPDIGSQAPIDDVVSGGASSDIDNASDNAAKDDANIEDELQKIKEELAREKAEKMRYKNSVDKLSKENSALNKKNRAMMSTDQLEKEAQEEQKKRIAEMEKEIRVNRYSKRSIALGMTESEADAFAATLPEMEDADNFFNALGNFIKSREKIASENAIQKLLKDRPDIHVGNNDADKDDPSMDYAKSFVARKQKMNSSATQDILKNYI